jgi:hypothetical protein
MVRTTTVLVSGVREGAGSSVGVEELVGVVPASSVAVGSRVGVDKGSAVGLGTNAIPVASESGREESPAHADRNADNVKTTVKRRFTNLSFPGNYNVRG